MKTTTSHINSILHWDGPHLLAALQAAAHWLEQHVLALNALNVFPVPDGDTGTNMSLTLKGALEEVAPDPSCAVVAERVGYWALMRGRGNSGIILSQMLRGLAQGLAGYARVGATEFAQALVYASNAASKAVLKPVEGTMLTVIREVSDAAQAAAAQGATLEALLETMVQHARESVKRTPQLLKSLHEAGVVDAGGQGVLLVLEGMLRYVRGEHLEAAPPALAAIATNAFEIDHGADPFGYCTNFVIQGEQMPFDEIRAAFAALGQSVVVVGDERLLKVHLHLPRPGEALNYAVQFGALSNIEITNMDLQHAALHHPATSAALSPRDDSEPVALTPVGVVAVAQGAGFNAILRSLNAGAVIDGGPTMNPSTADLLEAIEHLPQHDVIVLPNNRNIVLAAQQAAQLSNKRVEVVAAHTLPQGIAALLRFNYEADLATNAQTMAAALHDVQTAEFATAARDSTVGGMTVRAGQQIGMLNGEMVAAADTLLDAIDMTLDQLGLEEHEIVTIYYGRQVSQGEAAALAAHIRARGPHLDLIEVQNGGQSMYQYILSAE